MIRIIVAIAAGFGTWVFLNRFSLLHTEIESLGITWVSLFTLGVAFATLGIGKD